MSLFLCFSVSTHSLHFHTLSPLCCFCHRSLILLHETVATLSLLFFIQSLITLCLVTLFSFDPQSLHKFRCIEHCGVGILL
ncbi:hypothetical protein S245_003468 [Arachis hypogaea]